MSKIKVINSNTGQVKFHETESSSWGDLKAEISDMFQGNVDGVIRETSVTLQNENASLPTEKLTDESKDWDYTLFFVTSESKAGAGYENLDFQALRREVATRGYNNNGKNSQQLIEILRADDLDSQDDLSEAVERIEEKVDLILDFLLDAEITQLPESEPTAEEDELEFIANWQS